MDEDLIGDGLMHDAALVHSARRRMHEAIAELAAQPFDEAAAARMRQALRCSSGVRAALRRLRTPPGIPDARQPALHLVTGAARRAEPTAPVGPICFSDWSEQTAGGPA